MFLYNGSKELASVKSHTIMSSDSTLKNYFRKLYKTTVYWRYQKIPKEPQFPFNLLLEETIGN